MNIIDAELVLRLQKDEVSAFDNLYWKYHQAVYRNIFKFVKDAGATEDILQEVFTRLWEKRQDIQSDQSVAGWLFVISFNLSVNYVRKKLREQDLHKKLLVLDTEDERALDRKNIDEEQFSLLEQAIAMLSPKKRTIVTRCKLEGKTYDEVAHELNISRNTVKEHLSEAMIKLNDYMQRHGDHKYIFLLLLFLNYQGPSH
ncbi:RNA polymerase sigma factor [Chitinophaga nivalis]|uniref:Sigma-70 family RNA polymerase sigma factor n=1 Tax=Chitinophaga nivalis TaxID=2991709 RepID=A0ABT3IFF9_9BACT|nr:sigma-70 family RNA polymerase sigma factor [Chitinophaga nivalis]MCW3467607.1 sigma-70 family RNA polymerase sigma factor [Chitinophaga nivalis]MCW3482701.1 sigma-70 family RNA polymerase sigma factor [Chitinophaga nivalis]